MPAFMIRINCEYSLVLEAKDHDAAASRASEVDLLDWRQAFSDMEVAPHNPESVTPEAPVEDERRYDGCWHYSYERFCTQCDPATYGPCDDNCPYNHECEAEES